MRVTILLSTVFIAILIAITHYTDNQGHKNKKNLENLSVAIFSGGCFWCTEADFEKLPGVREAVSGFSGGQLANPSYEQVSKGGTGHVESVKVYYDSKKISYEQLVNAFWHMIDPTDNAGQFVDRGSEYRPVIFYQTDEQKAIAEKSRNALEVSKHFPLPIVVEIKKFESFYPAEEEHQDYYKNNPLRYKYYRTQSGRDQYLEQTWQSDRVQVSAPLKTTP